MILIKNGLIHDAMHREPYQADILVKGKKIQRIGKELEIPEDGDETEIIDAAGLEVYPGFVEAHSHIGLDGYGIGYEGAEFNESNDVWTPQLRAIDGINPMDRAFTTAVRAGVTTVCTGPGSANVLGGTFAVIKTVGKRVDDMVVKEAAAMKCAFGENPKSVYQEKNVSSRMTTAFILREALAKAREYMIKKEAAGGEPSDMPDLDMKLEALIPVLKKKIPLKAHAHAACDIFTALRIAREFDVKLTLEHVTEGHLIADELAKEHVPLAIGPTMTGASKYELRNLSWNTARVLSEAGCQVSIVTDAEVIPQEFLPLCAGLAVQAGMDPFAALQAITINPARHIGVEDRVGSLEEGKDADLVIADGNPMEVPARVRYVFVDGKMAKSPEDAQML